MTREEYKQFCADSKKDLESDFPQARADFSYYFDMAQGLLRTNAELARYVREERFPRGTLYAEALAEDLASGGNGV